MKGEQLPLSVQLPQAPELDNFFVGPNADAVAAVRDLMGGAPSGVLLFGAARSGKTHLLQAVARAAGPHALYLPLRTLSPAGVEALAGAGERDPVCIDDVETACTQEDWELSLLRLVDTLRARDARMLLSATTPPARLPLCLPDLRTRLAACAVIGIKPLRDADRRSLLKESAARRGLEMPDDVIRWLLNRYARDVGTLLAVLDELDRAALSAQRRLSLPFVQQTLRPPPVPERGSERTRSD